VNGRKLPGYIKLHFFRDFMNHRFSVYVGEILHDFHVMYIIVKQAALGIGKRLRDIFLFA
jgi:hypothetical protein